MERNSTEAVHCYGNWSWVGLFSHIVTLQLIKWKIWFLTVVSWLWEKIDEKVRLPSFIAAVRNLKRKTKKNNYRFCKTNAHSQCETNCAYSSWICVVRANLQPGERYRKKEQTTVSVYNNENFRLELRTTHQNWCRKRKLDVKNPAL